MSKPKINILILATLTVLVVAGTYFFLPAVPQAPEFHLFADTRSFFGIKNIGNVVSNAAFLFTGIAGIVQVCRTTLSRELRLIYLVLFTGVILTGLGSAFYHLEPGNFRLVFDRIPMTIVFMSLLSAVIAEFISLRAGFLLCIPLVLVGAGSVIGWYLSEINGHGDLRLYGIVQYYPALFITLVLILYPATTVTRGTPQLLWVVVWYAIAKIFESCDHRLFDVLPVISGHTLKHLAAAMSTWYLVRLFQVKHQH